MVVEGLRFPGVALACSLAAAAAAASGCAARDLAEYTPAPPKFEPEGQTKCAVRRSHEKPLVVEWPSADRAELEARAKSQVVVVRYDGCEMQLLPHCRAPGAYRYTSVSPKHDTVAIRTVGELYAQVPMGAAKLEAKLERAGELTVEMTMVGRLDAARAQIGRDELEGTCGGATHIMSGMTVGAFEFFAGARTGASGSVGLRRVGAGAEYEAGNETLTRDGRHEACEAAGPDAPPTECSAPLRIEVAPLGLPRRRAATCPKGSDWDGTHCVRTEVVTQTVTHTEAVCPGGSRWDGSRCVRRASPAPSTIDATSLAAEWNTLRGDKHEGEGWYCYVGEHRGREFGQCDRDRIECGMTMGRRIEAGLKTDSQRCEKQSVAACFQARRTMEKRVRTFCFPEPEICLEGHAEVASRDDVKKLTECKVYS